MNPMQKAAASVATLALIGAGNAAHAAFEGRFGDGTRSTPGNACTASGPTKCTFFYDTALDITILNIWRQTPWAPFQSPSGNTALAGAVALGASFSGALAPQFQTGWTLPTGDGSRPAGPDNQYRSIVESAGGRSGMFAQFDIAVDTSVWLWSSSEDVNNPANAWIFRTNGTQLSWDKTVSYGFLAIHSGDVAAGLTPPVPEPQTYAMMLLGLATLMVAVRRRGH